MARQCLESINLGYAYANIRPRQKKAWKPFIIMIVYTVRQMMSASPTNKYCELVQEECDLESMVNEANETTENEQMNEEHVVVYISERTITEDQLGLIETE